MNKETGKQNQNSDYYERRISRSTETDHSKREKYGKRAGSSWVPGLVEVKFRSANDSGLIDFDFSEPLDRATRPKYWSTGLTDVLIRFGMRTWRPSFPLRYSWSKESEEEARAFYSKSGRDRLITLRFPDDADVSRIAKDLQKLPEVTRANPVAKIAPPAGRATDEPLFGTSDQITMLGALEQQWYAFRCKLPEALERATGKDVIIADIDWGFDTLHEEYGEFIELTKNMFRLSADVTEGSQDHGTAVLGLAGARINYDGMVGFAPDSILWAIQAGSDSEFDSDIKYDDWKEAVDFVRAEDSTKRKVIILEIQTESGGNIEVTEAINQVVRDAIAANIVVCVPAGNSAGDAGKDDNNFDIPPTGSVLVGATFFDAVDNFVASKDGPRIVVYAPGDENHDVTCKTPSGHTNTFGGTSGAVAKVAGAVALMLEANGLLTPQEVREILGHSEIPVFNGPDNVGVLLDCDKAVTESLQRVTQPISEDVSCVPAT
jgi:subtilisin family serine protease